MAKKPADKPNQITSDELSYHQAALAQLQQAQVALDSWGRHLTVKYELGQKDTVGLDGVIKREVRGAETTE